MGIKASDMGIKASDMGIKASDMGIKASDMGIKASDMGIKAVLNQHVTWDHRRDGMGYMSIIPPRRVPP